MKELIAIQAELKCNKTLYNAFGKYYHRSVEIILESVKPLLSKYNCTLVISDDIVNIGTRYYVRATAVLTCGDKSVAVTAHAREEESKKGMDGAQITGATSSYARKYALGGLLAIDDSKDADIDADTTNEDDNLELTPQSSQWGKAIQYVAAHGLDPVLTKYSITEANRGILLCAAMELGDNNITKK